MHIGHVPESVTSFVTEETVIQTGGNWLQKASALLCAGVHIQHCASLNYLLGSYIYNLTCSLLLKVTLHVSISTSFGTYMGVVCNLE